jgi:hypothetical protein
MQINYQSMHPKQKLSFLSAKINHWIHTPIIKINNDIIKQVPFAKFLGVTTDQELTWTNHISSVLKSITN